MVLYSWVKILWLNTFLARVIIPIVFEMFFPIKLTCSFQVRLSSIITPRNLLCFVRSIGYNKMYLGKTTRENLKVPAHFAINLIHPNLLFHHRWNHCSKYDKLFLPRYDTKYRQKCISEIWVIIKFQVVIMNIIPLFFIHWYTKR